MTAGGPRDSRLAHALAGLYALAIVYASLQPFGDWMPPVPGTPFWLFGPWPTRTPRSDTIANALAYIPLGVFVSLMSPRALARRRVLIALVAGAGLSFAMETLQWHMPPRIANGIDLLANSFGALAGGALGAVYAPSVLRAALRGARTRLVLPGMIGDSGLALLAIWLVAQLNPAIPPFALTFDPASALGIGDVQRVRDVASPLIEAAQSAFQLAGVGLFVALLSRERRYAGGAVLMVVGAALVAKGGAAMLLLKPAVFVTWLSPSILAGVAIGALALMPAILLPRPAQVAICAIALLSSLLTPLIVPDLLFASPAMTAFGWRFGHLLNFNGLTHLVLVAWPLVASIWLFALAGRPAWGRVDGEAQPGRSGDPL